MIYVFLADGFEECEALVPIDILRRAGLEVITVGIGSDVIKGSHGIKVTCDTTDNKIHDSTEFLEAVILPGGMPGTVNLEKSETVQKNLKLAFDNNILIGAICAAPSILGHNGMLKGKKATCFTGFEAELTGAIISNLPVVTDGNVITAYGAGAAFPFGFALLEALKGPDKAKELKAQMRYN